MTKQEPPKVVRAADGSYEESHPSYGMARLSRVRGGSENLYGSAIAHTNYIELKIMRGKRSRHLNTDWYHGDNRPLISVKFSANQFAEFITTFDCGSGVPCTIHTVDGERMPECPERHIRQEIQDELDHKIRTLGEGLAELEKRFIELETPGVPVKKSDIRELRQRMSVAIRQLRDDLPFAQECFNEACDKSAAAAKAEIDAAFTGMIAKLGAEKLQERIQQLIGLSEAPQATLIEGSAVTAEDNADD